MDYLFFTGRLYNEQILCRYDEDEFNELFPVVPAVGDCINLPANDDDNKLYVVKKRIINPDCIEYIVKLYDWED